MRYSNRHRLTGVREDETRQRVDVAGEYRLDSRRFPLSEGGFRVLGALLVFAFIVAIGPLAVLYGLDSRVESDRSSFF